LRTWVPFIAILAIAATVRLWGIGTEPVLYFDSGVYLGEGAFLASAAAGDQAKSLTDLLPAMTSLAGLADVIACGSVGG